MSNGDSKAAYAYAERVRARLPRCLQEARESMGLSKYGLERRSGITREMISRIEQGKSNPSVCVTAQLVQALGLTMTQFLARVEEERRGVAGRGEMIVDS